MYSAVFLLLWRFCLFSFQKMNFLKETIVVAFIAFLVVVQGTIDRWI